MHIRHAKGGLPATEAPSATCAPDTLPGPFRKPGVRPGLGVNDGQADDFIALVEGWQGPEGETVFEQALSSAPAFSLDAIAAQLSVGQMRQAGSALLKLADAIDDNWDPGQVHASHHWITKAGQIERKSLQLAQVAMRMRAAAHRRRRHLASEWFGEPAWEMLLELFIQFSGGARVSTKSLAIASGAPDTTALRIMDRLEAAALIARSPSQMDKRVTLVSLTQQGVIAVGSVLMEAEG